MIEGRSIDAWFTLAFAMRTSDERPVPTLPVVCFARLVDADTARVIEAKAEAE